MVKGEDDMTMDEILNDKARIEYFEEYINNAIAAVVYDKVYPVQAYHMAHDGFWWLYFSPTKHVHDTMEIVK